MQFKVPKYLERESTIAFGLTFKALAVMGGLALLLFLLYYIIKSKVLFGFIVLVVVGGFFTFNFIKVRGQSLMEIFTNSFSFIFSPRTYLWQKKPGLKRIKVIKKKRGEKEKASLRIAPRSQLSEIKSKIDII